MRYVWRLEGPNTGNRALCEDRRPPCYETGNGLTGAYMAGFTYLKGLDGTHYYDKERHPCPSQIDITLEDGTLEYLSRVMEPNMFFGFANVEQARNWWFKEEDLRVAAESGFRMVAIPVEDVRVYHETPEQLVYRPQPWGKGECPVTRRIYFDPTWIHQMSQEEIEAWVDERLEHRRAA